MLSPLARQKWRHVHTGGEREDTCDHGLTTRLKSKRDPRLTQEEKEKEKTIKDNPAH